MVSLVLGLVVLYGSFSGEGLNEGMYEGLSIAMNGLYYGLLSYICLYILSYKFGTTEKIDAPLMNWHWMEVTGFLIFMFFYDLYTSLSLFKFKSPQGPIVHHEKDKR